MSCLSTEIIAANALGDILSSGPESKATLEISTCASCVSSGIAIENATTFQTHLSW